MWVMWIVSIVLFIVGGIIGYSINPLVLPQAAVNLMGQESQWFWAMLQSLVLFISLIFVLAQLRRLAEANNISAFSSSNSNWNSGRFREYRSTTCANYDKHDKSLNFMEGQIAGFFEELAIYEQKKIISFDFIWNMYSYYITGYWTLLEPKVKDFRKRYQDDSWYENFESLLIKVDKYTVDRGLRQEHKSDDEIAEFMEQERLSM